MKIFKWTGLIVLFLAFFGFIFIWSKNEPQPKVNPSPEADELAQKVLSALNKPAWDTLQGLKWEFPGGHKYSWNKKENSAIISWENHVVFINLDDQTGKVLTDDKEISGEDKKTLLNKAWSFWCNDSFWMFAPYKIFDPNTIRTIVEYAGKDALLVSYQGGGVTPGDSYLWILDDDYKPVAFKMWVSIIPVGGIKLSWEDWITLPSGAEVSTKHVGDLFTIDMKGVEEINI